MVTTDRYACMMGQSPRGHWIRGCTAPTRAPPQAEGDDGDRALEHPELPVRLRHDSVARYGAGEGSVIGPGLLDLMVPLSACSRSQTSADFEGRGSDRRGPRWTSIAAIEEGVPAPPHQRALLPFSSRLARSLRRQSTSAMPQAVRRTRLKNRQTASDLTRQRCGWSGARAVCDSKVPLGPSV